MGGRVEQMVVVGRRLLADGRGRRLRLWLVLQLLQRGLGGDVQLGHVKRILALLPVGPRPGGQISGI